MGIVLIQIRHGYDVESSVHVDYLPGNICPVIPADSGEARNAAVLPTCSIVVFSRIGATDDTCPSSFLKLPMPAAARVLMGPAEIALTRMPDGPKEPAMNRVFASR